MFHLQHVFAYVCISVWHDDFYGFFSVLFCFDCIVCGSRLYVIAVLFCEEYIANMLRRTRVHVNIKCKHIQIYKYTDIHKCVCNDSIFNRISFIFKYKVVYRLHIGSRWAANKCEKFINFYWKYWKKNIFWRKILILTHMFSSNSVTTNQWL